MKRTFTITIALGFVFALNANSAPFYKVECYNANNQLVSCNEPVKAKPKAKKKIAKKRTHPKETLAQRRARERAIALREQQKRNAQLKMELEALRKAELVVATKTEEAPAPTVQSAPAVTASIPAPVAFSSTKIVKNPEPSAQSSWALGLKDWVSRNFSAGSATNNELDISINYTLNQHIDFAVEQDIYWNWTNPEGKITKDNGWNMDDVLTIFSYGNLWVSESKKTTISFDITGAWGTSKESRDNDIYFTPRFRFLIKNTFNDGKAYIDFRPFITLSVRKYTTSAPTGSKKADTATLGADKYEKLTPNERFKTGVKTIFSHKLFNSLSFSPYVEVTCSDTYDQSVAGGTIVPSTWNNSLKFAFPRFTFGVTDSLSIDAYIDMKGPLSSFRPFSTNDKNGVTAVIIFDYTI